MTTWSSTIFFLARSRMSSSTDPDVTKLQRFGAGQGGMRRRWSRAGTVQGARHPVSHPPSSPVDVDRVLLADAVRARHGLQVVLRVPVCGGESGGRAGVDSRGRAPRAARGAGHSAGRGSRSRPRPARRPPESKMMTVSAVARLMPSPPARVDSRKAKSAEPADRCRARGAVGRREGEAWCSVARWRSAGCPRLHQQTRRDAAPPPTLGVEVVHGLVAQVGGRGAVQALVLVALEPHVVWVMAWVGGRGGVGWSGVGEGRGACGEWRCGF